MLIQSCKKLIKNVFQINNIDLPLYLRVPKIVIWNG